MQTTVRLEQEGDTGILIFECDEVGKPTTLDQQVLASLDAHLDTLTQCPRGELRAVIVRSALPKYFLVGANVNVLKTLDAETIVPWVRHGHRVLNRLAALPVPVIAVIEGYALGGGLEVALACDLILATHEAKLGQPEARLGMVSGWGGSYRLPRRIGMSRAKELFFTGKIVDAATAQAMGLVDVVGDRGELGNYVDAFMEGVRACSDLAVAQMKRLLDSSPDDTLDGSCEAEVRASQVCLGDAATQTRVADYLRSRKRA